VRSTVGEFQETLLYTLVSLRLAGYSHLNKFKLDSAFSWNDAGWEMNPEPPRRSFRLENQAILSEKRTNSLRPP
jgi:hypothetical protein